ncbi:YqjF family protein [Ornithinimicrobium cryptoxanthini]|uniref:DUF2071 domain-containing protein n=1 Tax=Ornithinimicrobium cryptoxanthini TaxID=2934161 RepID=A0ABY4YKR1_9MICO|nr:DUF2071 domain-containing protein [Ornithinimicrobium cryptoxanthini]USQ77319.1 DUF2071 domain-containing protein [Ornithinimicrobium cryptoxanthini]
MSGHDPDAPVRAAVNLQTWRHLTFLHWAYDVETVQSLVPPPLRVQTWEGQTWVGVIPFLMADVRLPRLPAPPGWDAFAELNVRCYVQAPDGRDGIWFLGMVVPRASFALSLRSIGLPYEVADGVVARGEDATDDARWDYRFGAPRGVLGLRTPQDSAWFTASVQTGAPLTAHERTPLVESLAGRWTAYHRRARALWRTPVEHEPWPLRHGTVTGELTTPLRWVGLPAPAGDPMVQTAEVVHARLGTFRPA